MECGYEDHSHHHRRRLADLAVLYLVFRTGQTGSRKKPETTLPPSVQRLVPPSWEVIQRIRRATSTVTNRMSGWSFTTTTASMSQPSGQPAGTTVTISPIGAVIYDAELESPPQAGDRPVPDYDHHPVPTAAGLCVRQGPGLPRRIGRAAHCCSRRVDKEGKCRPHGNRFPGLQRRQHQRRHLAADPSVPLPLGRREIWATKARF